MNGSDSDKKREVLLQKFSSCPPLASSHPPPGWDDDAMFNKTGLNFEESNLIKHAVSRESLFNKNILSNDFRLGGWGLTIGWEIEWEDQGKGYE